MTNITHQFTDRYDPYKGIIIYKNQGRDDHQIESCDFSLTGNPINFHPLSESEETELAGVLFSKDEQKRFLQITGILPTNVLHIYTSYNPFVIWTSRPMKVPLHFKENLDIPSGTAYVPPLVWKATREDLYIFATKTNRRPHLKDPLMKAPFFNIHQTGQVCMGDVDINIPADCSLVQFMGHWQRYFFASYFSYLIGGQDSPVEANIVQTWQKQMALSEKFPVDILKPSKLTIKDLLNEE